MSQDITDGDRRREAKVSSVDEVLHEINHVLHPWSWETFWVTLVTSSLSAWDVLSDEMLGVEFLLDQQPIFGILTILLTFLPGLNFYRYKKNMVGRKYTITWIFACLFFPITFLISKVKHMLN